MHCGQSHKCCTQLIPSINLSECSLLSSRFLLPRILPIIPNSLVLFFWRKESLCCSVYLPFSFSMKVYETWQAVLEIKGMPQTVPLFWSTPPIQILLLLLLKCPFSKVRIQSGTKAFQGSIETTVNTLLSRVSHGSNIYRVKKYTHGAPFTNSFSKQTSW